MSNRIKKAESISFSELNKKIFQAVSEHFSKDIKDNILREWVKNDIYRQNTSGTEIAHYKLNESTDKFEFGTRIFVGLKHRLHSYVSDKLLQKQGFKVDVELKPHLKGEYETYITYDELIAENVISVLSRNHGGVDIRDQFPSNGNIRTKIKSMVDSEIEKAIKRYAASNKGRQQE